MQVRRARRGGRRRGCGAWGARFEPAGADRSCRAVHSGTRAPATPLRPGAVAAEGSSAHKGPWWPRPPAAAAIVRHGPVVSQLGVSQSPKSAVLRPRMKQGARQTTSTSRSRIGARIVAYTVAACRDVAEAGLCARRESNLSMQTATFGDSSPAPVSTARAARTRRPEAGSGRSGVRRPFTAPPTGVCSVRPLARESTPGGGRDEGCLKVLVMVVVPLGAAGVAYGIAYDGAGVSACWATALGWLAGLVAVFVLNRFWCYRATFRFNVSSVNRWAGRRRGRARSSGRPRGSR